MIMILKNNNYICCKRLINLNNIIMAKKFKIEFKAKSLADYSKSMKENVNNADGLKKLAIQMEKDVELAKLAEDYKKKVDTLKSKRKEVKDLLSDIEGLEKKCVSMGIGKYEDTNEKK